MSLSFESNADHPATVPTRVCRAPELSTSARADRQRHCLTRTEVGVRKRVVPSFVRIHRQVRGDALTLRVEIEKGFRGVPRDCGAQVLLNATGSQPQPASGVARDHLLRNGIGVQPGADDRPPRHPIARTLAPHRTRLRLERAAARRARGERERQEQVAVVGVKDSLAPRDRVKAIEREMNGTLAFDWSVRGSRSAGVERCDRWPPAGCRGHHCCWS